MSGICGIFALDGSNPTLAQIAAMTAPLERRGPEGTHHVLCGPVALGHTLLATTPEALIEILPFTDFSTGCVITGDVRLDNRDELFLSLGMAQGLTTLGDGELVLRSYLKWGEGCVDHLLGDFAFAIWDPRAQRLFCARDHMGMRQLIYHYTPGRLFAFATEPRSVVTNPCVHKRLNEIRVADFILGLEGADFDSTFLEGVLRLPPAHTLTLGPQSFSVRRYWKLEPGRPLELGSHEDYAKAFLEVFTEAVRCRLRSQGGIGSMLSGGMVSGSVVAVASRLLFDRGEAALKTFSAIGSQRDDCVETRAILEAIAMPYLDSAVLSPDNLKDLDDDISPLADVDDPFDAHMVLIRMIYMQAKKSGLSVVLDGVAGDIALASDSYQARLLRRGQWFRAWREAIGEEKFFSDTGWTRWQSMEAALRRAFVPRWYHTFVGPLRARLFHRLRRSVLHREFASRVNVAGRLKLNRQANGTDGRNFTDDRCLSMGAANLVVGRERYDRVAGSCAIEPRDPFMDIRLLRFSLSLPGHVLQKDGWRKLVLRRAMDKLLPGKVIWRRGKQHLGWLYTSSLANQRPGILQLHPREVALLTRFLANEAHFTGGQAASGTDTTWNDFQLASLARWLHRQAFD